MTASVLKQDPNTKKDQLNAIIMTINQTCVLCFVLMNSVPFNLLYMFVSYFVPVIVSFEMSYVSLRPCLSALLPACLPLFLFFSPSDPPPPSSLYASPLPPPPPASTPPNTPPPPPSLSVSPPSLSACLHVCLSLSLGLSLFFYPPTHPFLSVCLCLSLSLSASPPPPAPGLSACQPLPPSVTLGYDYDDFHDGL